MAVLTYFLYINLGISQKSIVNTKNKPVNGNLINKNSVITIKKVDFFNKQALEKMAKEADLYIYKDYSIDKLRNKEFTFLGNNWYYLDSKIYKLINNELRSFDYYTNVPFKIKGYNTTACHYQINDSIVAVSPDIVNEYFYNIYTEKFIYTGLDNSGLLRLNFADLGSSTAESNSFSNFDNKGSNSLVKTDLVFNSIGGFSYQNEYCSNFLINNSTAILPKLNYDGSHVHIDNKFSRFIYIDGLLINKFDVSDNIQISNIGQPGGSSDNLGYGAFSYNDSLTFSVMLIKNVMQWKSIDFNDRLDISTSTLNNISKINDLNPLIYFEKKYNKKKLDINNSVDVKNSINTYRNLIGYNPYCIIVYNYRTKKIIGILDRVIAPFGEISKLVIDRENKILVAQSPDNYFTLFDIEKCQEIITIKGKFNSIDKNNNLVVNLDFTLNDVGNKNQGQKFPYLINYSEINLNDVVKMNDFSLTKDFATKSGMGDLDEFTNRRDFKYHIENRMNANINYISLAKKDTNFINLKYSNIDVYSNYMVKKNIEDDLKRYFNFLGVNHKVINIKFSYASYDQDRKELELFSNEVDDETYNNFRDKNMSHDDGYSKDCNFNLNLFGGFKNYHNINFQRAIISGNILSLKISPVDYTEAYAVKNEGYKIQFNIKNKIILESPSYSKIFLLKYKDFFDKKFDNYNRVVNGIITKSSNIFNNWFFVSNGIEQEFRRLSY